MLYAQVIVKLITIQFVFIERLVSLAFLLSINKMIFTDSSTYPNKTSTTLTCLLRHLQCFFQYTMIAGWYCAMIKLTVRSTFNVISSLIFTRRSNNCQQHCCNWIMIAWIGKAIGFLTFVGWLPLWYEDHRSVIDWEDSFAVFKMSMNWNQI